MHRRALLRRLGAVGLVAIAGCGEYESGPQTPPGDTTDQAQTETTTTPEDVFVVPEFAFEEGTGGDAVLVATVENTRDDPQQGEMVVRYADDGTTKSVTESIDLQGKDETTVRVKLPIAYADRNLQGIDFETAT
ncbi:hypothetical protein Hrd1104_05640 [Halorhabdus sp. CBA1104]|uniref:hypothetical protein n=1 Tax=Halorhabdus sp. CBA1104 TaxID=1380432 RepID=UPI0012B2F340|nr:hypothetical protein [Halorhabdus sp. CBA1104]QGN06825.1 hypothetical protein Hrd1104_05640 [Halorhabdus sp. CBA1104]